MKKMKILEQPIKVTEAEIDSFKEFASILDRHQAYSIKSEVFKKIWKGIWFTASFVLIIGAATYYFSTDKTIEYAQENSSGIDHSEEAMPPDTKENLSDSVSFSDLRPLSEETNVDDLIIVDYEKEGSTISSEKIIPIELETEGGKREPEPKALQEKEHFVRPSDKEFVYKEAAPKDGITMLYEYFEMNLKYPELMIIDSIQGEVIVRFTIKKTGEIDNIFIEKSLGELFDKEATRLIRNMPAWEPASVNGLSVDSRVSVPLRFRIE